MSTHPSLRAAEKMKRHRSVLTRLEKIKELLAKEEWDENRSPFGLPKVKHLKVTVKKEKAAEATEGEEGTGAAAEGQPAEKAGAADAAPGKEAPKAPGKDQAKGPQKA
tara:strand:- start:164 stop:487 length:324 start_codon:yes stop_codon:yes gene_type:complete